MTFFGEVGNLSKSKIKPLTIAIAWMINKASRVTHTWSQYVSLPSTFLLEVAELQGMTAALLEKNYAWWNWTPWSSMAIMWHREWRLQGHKYLPIMFKTIWEGADYAAVISADTQTSNLIFPLCRYKERYFFKVEGCFGFHLIFLQLLFDMKSIFHLSNSSALHRGARCFPYWWNCKNGAQAAIPVLVVCLLVW